MSSGLRTDHIGLRVLKLGRSMTGLEEYARRCRARRRSFISILFASQMESIALRRVRAALFHLLVHGQLLRVVPVPLRAAPEQVQQQVV